jgi:glycosyltransferase involved in cell wall biosynthesis
MELLPLLADRFDIDLVVDALQGAEHRSEFVLPAGASGLLSAHDFVWRRLHAPYDLTVFQVGNAACHDYMWPYLFHYPGVVVLHDGQLHHARASRLLVQRRFQDYRDELAYSHPDTRPDLAEFGIAGLRGASYYFWPMLRAVIDAARWVAVHSARLAADLREQFPASSIELVDMGVSDPLSGGRRGGAVRERYGISPGAVVFAAFGMVTPEKRIEPVLDALPVVLRSSPDAVLLLVGEVPPHFDPVVQARARHVEDRVIVTGYVPDTELAGFLDAADVCLCMRWPSSREISASGLRCLAAGKPTVITDLVHTVDVPALDPRTWTLNYAPDVEGDRIAQPVAVGIDVVDEDHSVRLAMTRLATDAALRDRLGRNARERWARLHTLERMAARYGDILERALGSSVMRGPDTRRDLPAHLVDDGGRRLRDEMAKLGRPFAW